MTVLVDTGVLYARAHARSTRHAEAQGAMATVLGGSLGRPLVSDYLVDEAYTLVLARTGSPRTARTLRDRLLGADPHPRVFELLWVTPEIFHAAVEVLDRFPDQRLSFTDATTVALVEGHDVDHVLTFDAGFSGLVPRLDPADLA